MPVSELEKKPDKMIRKSRNSNREGIEASFNVVYRLYEGCRVICLLFQELACYRKNLALEG
ncbi:hypothetical protein A3741_28875 [Oleiphilus sp. HI0069]|nr:hypothetical protein A3741_28875 [Oleiphilus sp. HI0069]KZZ71884.1 hypothetical protein A3766_22325 [Oleiphilus sp. HI0132]